MIAQLRGAAFDFVHQRFFYGWTVLAVAAFGLFASGPGQSHTFSVFVEPIGADLGISNASIATAYGAATLVAALLLPQMGRYLDRIGPRWMLVAVACLLAVACALFGAAANFLWLAVGFGVLRFLGQGSLMLCCANLTSHWFNRRRGFAMSLMALGFGVSMAVHPPLSQYLVGELGWRQAWVVLGLLSWVCVVPPVLLLVYNKPEDVGLLPDGERPAANAEVSEQKTTQPVQGLTLREALRTPAFYILAAGWFLMAMLVTTLHFYQVSILTAQGVSADVAARAFTVSAVAMVITMPFVGRLFDSVRTRYVFAAGLLITATSLFGVTLAYSPASAVVYAVAFGINNAFTMTMLGYLWPRYFGRKHLGAIQGTGQMIGVIGASVGPLPVGLAFDLFDSATGTLRLLALLPVICAIVAMSLRTPPGIQAPEHLE